MNKNNITELYNELYNVIENKILEILDKIKNVKLIGEAQTHFNDLGDIQLFLAKLSFKYNLPLSKNLNKFVSDFDRIDDEQQRLYFFNQIQLGEYTLESQPNCD